MERDKIKKEYILFTSNNFPIGGPGAVYVNLFCKGVVENAGKISVYLFKGHLYKNYKNHNGRKSYTDYGVKYMYLGFSNRSRNAVLKLFEDVVCILRTIGLMMKLIFKRNKISIFIYSDALLFNAPVYFFSKIFGIKIISFVFEFLEDQDYIKQNLTQQLKSYSFLINFNYLNKFSDRLIVFSDFLRNEYVRMGYNEQNILVQPNLTELSEWYIPNRPTVYTIGYAGTPSKKDGIFDLISSIKLLKDQGKIITAIIVGDAVGNESYLPKIKEFVKLLGISNQLTFTGLVPQQEVKSYLNTCQILAITRPNTKQTKAGFPTKLGEYMACKKVVLATNFGDIEKYFIDKTEIVFAESENPASIAQNISWILDNEQKSKVIAQKAFDVASEILDYKNGVKRIMEFIN